MADEAARIDVWWFRLPASAAVAEAALPLLDPEERSRFRRFPDVTVAAFFAFRRAARRVVLSSYLDERAERLRFAEEERGKPILRHPRGDIGFSASDTGTTGVIAVTRGMSVGVDIERAGREVPPRLAERILSAAELRQWRRVAPSEKPRTLLRAWTAKEALAKAIGVGLDLPAFREMTLASDGGGGAWQPALLGPGLLTRGSWHVRDLLLAPEPAEPLVASVAAPVPSPVTLLDARSLLSRHGL